MTILFKLTDPDGFTRRGESNQCHWSPGIRHRAKGKGGELCSDSWIHAYEDPILGLMLNPIHADIKAPRLWKCRGKIGASDNGLKVGCKSLLILEELPVPKVERWHRVGFGILCEKEVWEDRSWNKWADRWLSGRDRTAKSARAAADAYAAYAAAAAAAAAAYAAVARSKQINLITLAHKAMLITESLT